MGVHFGASFGQYTYDSWRKFVLLKEIPKIEAVFLNWMTALWVQIFLLLILLIVGFLKLHRQSKIVHSDVLSTSGDRSRKGKTEGLSNVLHVPGLHDLVLSYYQYLVLNFREVRYHINGNNSDNNKTH